MAAADWSDAPVDLLRMIIDQLPITDYIRFGAVCVSWRNVLKERRPPPQAPWLLLPDASRKGTGTKSPVRFFSLSDGKEYHLDIPQSLHKLTCIGSSHGWMLFLDLSNPQSEISMFDPISRAQNTLPSIATLTVGLIPGNYHQYPDLVRFMKVVVSPYRSSSFIGAAVKLFTRDLAFARKGDKSWTTIKRAGDYLCDIIFYKKQICALTIGGSVVVCDISRISQPNVTLVMPCTKLEFEYVPSIRYLVEAGGDLLQVYRGLREETEEAIMQAWRSPTEKIDGKLETVAVNVFKMDRARAKWVELESLGDHALFLGCNPSLAVSSRKFSELNGNCIYLTNMFRIEDWGSDLLTYDMEDGTFQPLLTLSKSKLMRPRMFWFTPNISVCYKKIS